jgi:hypothetical protein
MSARNCLVFGIVPLGVLATSSTVLAGISPMQLTIADTWPGAPVAVTTALPNTNSTTGNGGFASGGVTLTYRTGASPIMLDSLSIVAAGGPGPVKLAVYPSPVGGTEADGFVNVSFSTDLLSGNAFGSTAGVEFTFNGTADETILNLDLTGDDQITLAANTLYAFDFTSVTNFFVRRGGQFYTADGNIYSRNVTPDDGQRFDPAGGRRDAPLALYAVPEPATLAAVAGAGALALGRRRRA